MKSIRYLYKIGYGPSSSHTMAPYNAAVKFKEEFAGRDECKVVLYGSLAKTGRGHMTDKAVISALEPIKATVEFNTEQEELPHPNTMDFCAFKNGKLIAKQRVFSIGGGSIAIEGRREPLEEDIYPHKNFEEIKQYCIDSNIRLWQYVERFEGSEIWDYLSEIWTVMQNSIDEGLRAEGILAGGLGTQRKAKYLYNQRHIDESPETKESRIVASYAYAASEQNAGMGLVATSPTCGACGVLPSVLRYMQEKKGFSDRQILYALATAGIIGNVIKTNASISGAECGCQAEIGSACCMAAAGLSELFDMDLDQIEYAAEVSMEHHLGLTCDPIDGLVQIPCIERNAVAAMRAINSLNLANFLTNTRKISFDTVVAAMYETGKNMHYFYRETSEGGLAAKYNKEKKEV